MDLTALARDKEAAQAPANKGVGCGCLGAIVGMLLGTYWLATTWMEQPDFALLLTAVMGLALYGATTMRGYHLVSLFAWIGLGSLSLGAAPILYRMIYPERPVDFLPSWLQHQYGPLAFLLVGGALVGGMVWQMSRTVSSADAIFSIQLQAAARKVDVQTLTPQVNAALDVLQESARLGAWPMSAPYISYGDPVARPKGVDTFWMPVRAVLAKAEPEEGGWLELGAQPWMVAPEAWEATVDKMGPLAVGALYCDTSQVCFDPEMTGKPLRVPLADIDAIRVKMHALELKVGGELYTFVAMHAWRLASLIYFLRVFQAREVNGALWATQARPGVSAPAAFTRIPSEDALAEALDGLEVAPGSAQALAVESIRDLVAPWPTWRAVGARLLACWGALEAGSLDKADHGLRELEQLCEGFPEGALPLAPLGVMDDLKGVVMVRQENWPALLEHVADLEPWAEEEQGGADQESQEEDPRHEALVEAVQALHQDRPGSAREALERARSGYPDAMLIEALAEQLRQESQGALQG